MSGRPRRFREKEEQELLEIRKLVDAQEEFYRVQKLRRGKEREIRPTRLETQVVNMLDQANRRSKHILVEADAWQSVFQGKVDQLKQKEEDLDRDYESVWKKREEFLTEAEIFIRDFHKFANSAEVAQFKELRPRLKEIEQDLEILHLNVNRRKAAVEVLSTKLQMLEQERMKMKDEITPEVLRLEDWIITTCLKCQEMDKDIAEKKMSIYKKNAALIRCFKMKKNNLFSIVNLDDVKKLTPFTTDNNLSPP